MTKANGCLFTELDTYGENILTNYLPFSKTDKHSKVRPKIIEDAV